MITLLIPFIASNRAIGDEQFLLRSVPVLGQKTRMESGFTMTTKDREISVNLSGQTEITQKFPDGGYESVMTLLKQEFRVNGELKEAPLPKRSVRLYDKDQNPIGEPESLNPANPPSVIPQLIKGHDPVEPKRIGDVWKQKSRVGQTTFTLIGKEKLQDHPCLKIKVDARLSLSGATADVSGTIFIRESDKATEFARLTTENYRVGGPDSEPIGVNFWAKRIQ